MCASKNTEPTGPLGSHSGLRHASVYMHVCVCTYTNAQIYTYMHIYIYMCVYVCTYTHMHIQDICIYIYIYIHTYIYTYIYIYTYKYTYIYIYTHVRLEKHWAHRLTGLTFRSQTRKCLPKLSGWTAKLCWTLSQLLEKSLTRCRHTHALMHQHTQKQLESLELQVLTIHA